MRNQLMEMLYSTAMGRVVGFADVFRHWRPCGNGDPSGRTCDWLERARDPPKFRELRDDTFTICLSWQIHNNLLNYQHNL